ncbi:hypothetical protein [Paludisphaera mucosa]|uniref:Uncharacterized protein n=1 Tax=Paludisphaera mucosa TaxID=3030827 RepID=A0ABT6FKQ1_9BACT|nr:hypothetical protein [Paludisphaera mucosa]MDG3008081.1 hypothetical protein [Paludisphaera mucosa]
MRDGLDDAAFVSELLQGRASDMRGAAWLSYPGCNSYMSSLTPNGSTNRAMGYERDVLHHPSACVDEPGRGLACEGDPDGVLSRWSPPPPGGPEKPPARAGGPSPGGGM